MLLWPPRGNSAQTTVTCRWHSPQHASGFHRSQTPFLVDIFWMMMDRGWVERWQSAGEMCTVCLCIYLEEFMVEVLDILSWNGHLSSAWSQPSRQQGYLSFRYECAICWLVDNVMICWHERKRFYVSDKLLKQYLITSLAGARYHLLSVFNSLIDVPCFS